MLVLPNQMCMVDHKLKVGQLQPQKFLHIKAPGIGITSTGQGS